MNKASGDDGIPVVLLQNLKDDPVKVLHWICQQIWKTQQCPQDLKRSVFIPTPKKGNAKECSNYCTIALFSHTRKEMFKILQARLQQYMNRELPDVQAGFRKGRGTRDQIANIRWIIEKARVPEKHLLLLYWLSQSLWLCGSQQTVEKLSDHLTCLLRNLYADQEATVRIGHNRLVPNRERSTSRLYIVTLLILTYMQSISWDSLGWMKLKLELRLLGEI